jgi:hypothetical protein
VTPPDWRVVLRRAHARRLFHPALGFYLALAAEVVEPWSPEGRVFDFGSVGPEFLSVLALAHEYGDGVGVVLPADPAPANRPDLRVRFVPVGEPLGSGCFDAGFSQEALGFVPDLAAHARQAHEWLRPGGLYYAAFGWHTANPGWEARSSRLRASGRELCRHSPDDAARALRDAGFEVAVKRLPVLSGAVYDPAVAGESGLVAMLDEITESKLLFRCLKQEGPRA